MSWGNGMCWWFGDGSVMEDEISFDDIYDDYLRCVIFRENGEMMGV